MRARPRPLDGPMRDGTLTPRVSRSGSFASAARSIGRPARAPACRRAPAPSRGPRDRPAAPPPAALSFKSRGGGAKARGGRGTPRGFAPPPPHPPPPTRAARRSHTPRAAPSARGAGGRALSGEPRLAPERSRSFVSRSLFPSRSVAPPRRRASGRPSDARPAPGTNDHRPDAAVPSARLRLRARGAIGAASELSRWGSWSASEPQR